MCDRLKEKVDKFIDTIEGIWSETTGYSGELGAINTLLNRALKELHDEP